MKRIRRLAVLLSAVLLLTTAACHSSGRDQPAQEESSEVVSEITSVVSEVESKAPEEESSQTSKETKKTVKKPAKETSTPAKVSFPEADLDSSREILADFSSLLAQNPDTVGWIDVPNTIIDFPVVQYMGDAVKSAYNEDPYYLYKDFYGNYLYSGTVFMDYRSQIGFKNMLLHGHAMVDGNMFYSLLYYASLDFYKTAPVISFNTLYEKAKWKVIAVIKANVDESHGTPFHYMRSTFSSDYDFLNYVHEVRQRSIIDCPVDVNENDSLLTLSTCCYDYNDFRLAVIARKVRPGEDSKVAISKAKYNPNPIYPDVVYWYGGGYKPEETTFQEALNSKKITWYNGKKKWSAADDQALAKTLAEVKSNAEKTIREGFNEKEYSKAQNASINDIIDIYLPYVQRADDYSKVRDLCFQAIAVIKNIQPDTQKVQEEQAALQKQQTNALSDIRKTIQGKTYRSAQQTRVNEILNTYDKKIKDCSDPDQINTLKEEAIKKLAAVKTDAQLTAEAAAKKNS